MSHHRTAVLLGCAMLFVVGAELRAGEDAPGQGNTTSARATAEVGFAAIRKAATDHDEPTLAACLPSKLVTGWTELSAGDGKAWRAALAARIADGTVVRVHETGDSAIARWEAGRPASIFEVKLVFDGKRWVVASPCAYCVGGAELAKANGRGSAHVKLKARTNPKVYGPSAFSFVHVTQDPKQCKNRMDIVWCRCGQLHLRGAMLSALKATDLDKLDGIQAGGDWQDEIVPKNGAVYVIDCQEKDRKDFQLAIRVTSLSDDAMEFDWRLVAAGLDAPASIRSPQPDSGTDGDDGTDAICGTRRK